MKHNPQPRVAKAFTLMELLVAITIVILLAGMSIGGYKYVATKQAQKKAEVQVQLLANSIQEYQLDKGTFPPSTGSTYPIFEALWRTGNMTPNTEKIYLPDLDPVNNKHGWINGTGTDAKILDPWGREYIYRSPGIINPDFDIISMGPDGLTSDTRSNSQNKDDVTN
jgi:general secretion pathway protein G